MSDKIEVLAKKDVCGTELTFYGTVEEPLFFAKDVANMIDHSNVSVMLNTIDDDEKIKMTNLNNVYGGQEAWFVTEHGLYEVLFQSRKPIAKQFKNEVKRILHDLRVNGVVVSRSMAMQPQDIQMEAFQKAIDNTVANTLTWARTQMEQMQAEFRRTKAQITKGREGKLFSENGIKTQQIESLKEKIEEQKMKIEEQDAQLKIDTPDAIKKRTWCGNISKGLLRHYRGKDYDKSETCYVQPDLFEMFGESERGDDAISS